MEDKLLNDLKKTVKLLDKQTNQGQCYKKRDKLDKTYKIISDRLTKETELCIPIILDNISKDIYNEVKIKDCLEKKKIKRFNQRTHI